MNPQKDAPYRAHALQPKILTTMRGYRRSDFRRDFFAGLTVALVALPLSLAIAIASGVSPAQGLITAIVGGFLISALGGSRVQIGGPTGAFIIVVYDVIAKHGYDGLVFATLMAGGILVVAGQLRMGRYITLVPEPVINGFTIGIAIIIAASQIAAFLGLTTGALPADFLGKLGAIWAARTTLNPYAIILGGTAIGLIAAIRHFRPRFPAMFIVALALSGLAVAVALPVDSVASRFGALPHSLPMPTWPQLPPEGIIALIPSAIIIAFLAGIESLLSAVVADRMIGGQHRPNAELMAQGIANIGSAMVMGLPVTGAIARTATNVNAGGRTPVAGMIHALVLLLALLFAAPLIGGLALPVLAAILLLTAWHMAEPRRWAGYARAPIRDRLVMLATLLLTVLVDLTVAILAGLMLWAVLDRTHRGNKTGAG